jgi:hypothetical protein
MIIAGNVGAQERIPIPIRGVDARIGPNDGKAPIFNGISKLKSDRNTRRSIRVPMPDCFHLSQRRDIRPTDY